MITNKIKKDNRYKVSKKYRNKINKTQKTKKINKQIYKLRGSYEFVTFKGIKGKIRGVYNFNINTNRLSYPDRLNQKNNSSILINNKHKFPDNYLDIINNKNIFIKNLKKTNDHYDFLEHLVILSAIDYEIEKEENKDCFFVLPSQLNGAEYPSYEKKYIVKKINQYKFDNTGGPRGQLAVHPACGQFISDNASNDNNLYGLNAVKDIVDIINDNNYDITLKNGYLKVPPQNNKSIKFKNNLEHIKILGMKDVKVDGYYYGRNNPESGSTRNKKLYSVNLVYASAIPINTYTNKYISENLKSIANSILIAQYYGALCEAFKHNYKKKEGKKIFLMPLGGGVFNNDIKDITECLLKSIILVKIKYPSFFKYVKPKILSFHKNESESKNIKQHILKLIS
jgi:hypothetical protein